MATYIESLEEFFKNDIDGLKKKWLDLKSNNKERPGTMVRIENAIENLISEIQKCSRQTKSIEIGDVLKNLYPKERYLQEAKEEILDYNLWVKESMQTQEDQESEEYGSMNIEIKNLLPRQIQEFKKFFSWVQFLGVSGSSRDFNVSVDGDGSFRSEIIIDGKENFDEEVFTEQELEDMEDRKKISFSFE